MNGFDLHERRPPHARLEASAALALSVWADHMAACNTDGRVSRRSQWLCAGLGELSLAVYRALGGRGREAEVVAAGAGLSLLTKLDDQVIDSPAFHGGFGGDEAMVRRRVEAYLAPTLASLRAGEAVDGEPRCAMAAEVGRRLVALAGDRGRLDHLVGVVARGWAIQVDAVATFTRHPSRVGLAEVERVTASISGLWLLMIAMVGVLPDEVGRPMTADEEEAFIGWGLHIQRADALADFHKDLQEGLCCTAPGWRLQEVAPEVFEAAVSGREGEEALFEALAAWGIDLTCVPTVAELERLEARLGGLGEVGRWLRWINVLLLWRYAIHPHARRGVDDPAWRGALAGWEEVASFVDAIVGRREELFVGGEAVGGQACSGR